MTHQTARYTLKRHGLACFSVRELSGLLSDRYRPLPDDVKTAILTLRTPQKSTHNNGAMTYGY